MKTMKIKRDSILPYEDLLPYIAIGVGAIIACLIVIYAMKFRGKKEAESLKEEDRSIEPRSSPFKIVKTVPSDEAANAKDELRILDLEREILSDAIRRLYEAHAEGKITEEERERLAQTYKSRMMTVKDAISKDESVVALHELEAMQEDLIKLFSERFDELSTKVEELRSRVEVKPIKEIAIPLAEAPTETTQIEKPATTTEEKEKKKRKKPAAKPSPKTEAERRIDEIREEVEKVLDKLGQMEIET
jgi:MFS superfamily sulfate permease-like transporter